MALSFPASRPIDDPTLIRRGPLELWIATYAAAGAGATMTAANFAGPMSPEISFDPSKTYHDIDSMFSLSAIDTMPTKESLTISGVMLKTTLLQFQRVLNITSGRTSGDDTTAGSLNVGNDFSTTFAQVVLRGSDLSKYGPSAMRSLILWRALFTKIGPVKGGRNGEDQLPFTVTAYIDTSYAPSPGSGNGTLYSWQAV